MTNKLERGTPEIPVNLREFLGECQKSPFDFGVNKISITRTPEDPNSLSKTETTISVVIGQISNAPDPLSVHLVKEDGPSQRDPVIQTNRGVAGWFWVPDANQPLQEDDLVIHGDVTVPKMQIVNPTTIDRLNAHHLSEQISNGVTITVSSNGLYQIVNHLLRPEASQLEKVTGATIFGVHKQYRDSATWQVPLKDAVREYTELQKMSHAAGW